MGDWNGGPQQLLASVTESVQRFTKQLQPRKLEFKSPQATQTNASKRPVSHRAPVVGFKSHQVVIEGEGVLTPLQVTAHFWADLWSSGLTWSLRPSCHESVTSGLPVHHMPVVRYPGCWQVRNNVHRAAIMLGAAVLGKLGRMGNKLKEHHHRLKEEGWLL